MLGGGAAAAGPVAAIPVSPISGPPPFPALQQNLGIRQPFFGAQAKASNMAGIAAFERAEHAGVMEASAVAAEGHDVARAMEASAAAADAAEREDIARAMEASAADAAAAGGLMNLGGGAAPAALLPVPAARATQESVNALRARLITLCQLVDFTGSIDPELKAEFDKARLCEHRDIHIGNGGEVALSLLAGIKSLCAFILRLIETRALEFNQLYSEEDRKFRSANDAMKTAERDARIAAAGVAAAAAAVDANDGAAAARKVLAGNGSAAPLVPLELLIDEAPTKLGLGGESLNFSDYVGGADVKKTNADKFAAATAAGRNMAAKLIESRLTAEAKAADAAEQAQRLRKAFVEVQTRRREQLEWFSRVSNARHAANEDIQKANRDADNALSAGTADTFQIHCADEAVHSVTRALTALNEIRNAIQRVQELQAPPPAPRRRRTPRNRKSSRRTRKNTH